tara:strand:- start:4540 stop:5226 length:687 start_codon:yes stop_codon:yes gene_type:complete
MAFNNLRNEYQDIPNLIHQAALDPHLNNDSLNQICDLAKHFNFSGLCTHPIRLPQARNSLGKSSQTKLIAVISFPFGSIPITLKKKEAEWALDQGAEELDVSPNFLALSQGDINLFAEELSELCQLDLPVRAILDITNLPKQKLSLAVEASIEAGVSGLQSGNGFGPAISTQQIKELNKLVKGRCAIKAVGGIKTLNHAIELIDAGANQIGTSFGSQLMQELREFKKE